MGGKDHYHRRHTKRSNDRSHVTPTEHTLLKLKSLKNEIHQTNEWVIIYEFLDRCVARHTGPKAGLSGFRVILRITGILAAKPVKAAR